LGGGSKKVEGKKAKGDSREEANCATENQGQKRRGMPSKMVTTSMNTSGKKMLRDIAIIGSEGKKRGGAGSHVDHKGVRERGHIKESESIYSNFHRTKGKNILSGRGGHRGGKRRSPCISPNVLNGGKYRDRQ